MRFGLPATFLFLYFSTFVMPATAAGEIAHPPSFGQVTEQGTYEARMVEVYHQDFEGPLDGVFLNGAVVSNVAPLAGSRSVRLDSDFATLRLEPQALGLEPFRTYYVEFDYQVLDPGAEIAPFGLFFDWTGVTPEAQDSSGPLTGVYPVAGRFGRSVRVGASDASITLVAFSGRAIIDNITVSRHDSLLVAAEPPIFDFGFPRLLGYHLGSLGGDAQRNNKSIDEVADTLSLFDVVSGVDPDHTTDAYASSSRLKEANPNLIMLPYLEAFVLETNDLAISTGGTSNLTALFQEGIEDAWYMREPDGSLLEAPFYPGHFQMNHTGLGTEVNGVDFNDYVQGYMTQSLLPSGLWQGIHLDQSEWFPNPLLGSNDGFNSTNAPLPPIDIDEDGVAESDAELSGAWLQAYHDYLGELRRKVGPATILYGNAGLLPQRPSVLRRLNGMQRELATPYPIDADGNWETASMAGWFDLLSRQQLADQFLAAPQLTGIQYTGIGLGSIQSGPIFGIAERVSEVEVRDYQRMRLGLTSTLLQDSGFYGYNLVGASSFPIWFDEYAVNAAGVADKSLSGKHYLGQPLAESGEVAAAGFQIVAEADFETGAARPHGLFLAPGFELTGAAEQVLSGNQSAIFEYDPTNPESGLIFGLNAAEETLQAGSVYQVSMRYKVLSMTNPEDNLAVAFIAFQHPGSNEPFADATLWNADPGQTGELRTGMHILESGVGVVGAFSGPARMVVDDIKVTRGASVFRRDFENGIVLVNPSSIPVHLTQADIAGALQRTGIRRIAGIQDPVHNDGSAVTSGITLGPADGIVLLADNIVAAAITPPAGVAAVAGTDTADISWMPGSGTVAGYLVRYGMTGGDLTRFTMVAKTPVATLETLEPGTNYDVQVATFDFLGTTSEFSAPVEFSTSGVSSVRPAIIELPWLSPGAVLEITGQGLADVLSAAEAPFPNSLAGTRVLINGLPAPIIVTEPNKVLVMVPWNLGGDRAIVRLEQNGVVSPARFTQIVSAQPVLWSWENDLGIAFRPGDFSPVLPGAPGIPGEQINLLVSTLGAMEPLPAPGSLPAPSAQPLSMPTVTIDGVAAKVTDARLFGRFVGFYTVTIEVPTGIGAGMLEVVLESGGRDSNRVKIEFDGTGN